MPPPKPPPVPPVPPIAEAPAVPAMAACCGANGVEPPVIEENPPAVPPVPIAPPGPPAPTAIVRTCAAETYNGTPCGVHAPAPPPPPPAVEADACPPPPPAPPLQAITYKIEAAVEGTVHADDVLLGVQLNKPLGSLHVVFVPFVEQLMDLKVGVYPPDEFDASRIIR